MELRFLSRDDAPEWLRLRLEALRGDPDAFSASTEEYEVLDPEEVRRRLRLEGDSFVMGAFDDGHMIGMAGFYRENGLKSRHKGRVWGVYVTPHKRGEKVGRQLLEALLDRAGRISGLEQVLLSVSATQTAAVKLYRSLGFESFGREPQSLKVGERRIDEEYMILRLRSPDAERA